MVKVLISLGAKKIFKWCEATWLENVDSPAERVPISVVRDIAPTPDFELACNAYLVPHNGVSVVVLVPWPSLDHF